QVFVFPPVRSSWYFDSGFRPVTIKVSLSTSGTVTSPLTTGTSALAKSASVWPAMTAPVRLTPSASSTWRFLVSLSPISSTSKNKSSLLGVAGETTTRDAPGTTCSIFDGEMRWRSSPQNVSHILCRYGSVGSGPPCASSIGQFLPEPHAPPNSSPGAQNSHPG